mmetsp:Transcript_58480/g.134175  ORF Transcript_58480/g.134175 Transcript_58480/m.134175 type:complete len:305 (-) Transcript_58480:208-1122(-)
MRESDAQVAHDRRVGEVSLPARDGQLRAQVREERVGEAEVALRILKVDRIDLVGHRRRANLALHDALLKITHRDVAPHVAREIDQDRVEALKGVEELSDEIVRLDLGDVRVVLQSERLNKSAREGGPIGSWARHCVRIEGADGACDLAEDGRALHRVELLPQPVDNVGQLLAHRGWRRWLPVRVGEHRHFGQIARLLSDLVDELLHHGQQHLFASLKQHQRVREVVDVLRRACEVEKLERAEQLVDGLAIGALRSNSYLLKEVLDGLDVVVSCALDRLDALRLVDVKVGNNCLKRCTSVSAELG